MHSHYDDARGTARRARWGRHRVVVGGMWEEIGRLQFDYLQSNGLQPGSKFIDIGCGALRGGVRFATYLDAGCYFGVDSNQSLLDAGLKRELAPLGLARKVGRAQLVCSSEFEFGAFPDGFDFALAQSLFTHLPLNHLRLCLARLAPKMKRGGRFFATFFLMPDDHAVGAPLEHALGGFTTYDWRDPYHYYVRDLAYAAQGLPWEMTLRADYAHPRDQQMVEFVRQPG